MMKSQSHTCGPKVLLVDYSSAANPKSKRKVSNRDYSSHQLDLLCHNLTLPIGEIHRNLSPSQLYEFALRFDADSQLASSGALACNSGARTGRSPLDKRVVSDPSSYKNIWWGDVNIPLEETSFLINRERALTYLNTRPRLYVFDGYAGWDPTYRIKVRVICARPYHALFMHNMLIRPTESELANFGEPDFTIFNSGEFPANRYTKGMTSSTSVALHFGRQEMVILGTEYAGEMKKGVFTLMNYLMPLKGVLSLHASANVSVKNPQDVTLFFGLSGTGKTTLSTEPSRKLIGDDETCWSDNGVFNIEGGCYAKCINLKKELEPEIFGAIKFGSILENVTINPSTREVDYSSSERTENTRASYPIEYIENAQIPCQATHPKNIIMLCCDSFGVIPPVSKLTPHQAAYYFLLGYTSKVAGTEVGVDKPQPVFSPCFGAAFMVWHPVVYSELLIQKIKKYDVNVWLINTGWSGGCYGVGERMKLKWTRSIVDAIHNGVLKESEESNWEMFNLFGLKTPKVVEGVPNDILNPRNCWADKTAFDNTTEELARSFNQAFENFYLAEGHSNIAEEILGAGPQLGNGCVNASC